MPNGLGSVENTGREHVQAYQMHQGLLTSV